MLIRLSNLACDRLWAGLAEKIAHQSAALADANRLIEKFGRRAANLR